MSIGSFSTIHSSANTRGLYRRNSAAQAAIGDHDLPRPHGTRVDWGRLQPLRLAGNRGCGFTLASRFPVGMYHVRSGRILSLDDLGWFGRSRMVAGDSVRQHR